MEKQVSTNTALWPFAALIVAALVAVVSVSVPAYRLTSAPTFQYSSDSESPALSVQPRSGHIVNPQPATYYSVQTTGLTGQLQ